MSKTVVFCENYGVIDRTLYLVTHKHPITIVILDNRDLFNFFQVLNDRVFGKNFDLINIESYQTIRTKPNGTSKITNFILDTIKERRNLIEIFNKYFAGLEGCEVFFSGRFFCGYLFYLLKKLGKRNRLVYISMERPNATLACPYVPMNIVDLLRLIIHKIIYGHDIVMAKLPHLKGFPYMPDKFIENEVDRIIEWEEQNEMMKDFDLNRFKIFDVGNYSVIYFDQPLFDAGYVACLDTYKRELTDVFNVLCKYYSEKEIIRKYHPNITTDKTMIKIGDVLPDFIPSEFLSYKNAKIFIGFSSRALATIEKGLTVSLIDFISFKNDKIRKSLKEMLLIMCKSEILFPKTMDEFEKILVSLKRGLH